MVYNVDVPPKDGVTSLPVRVEIDMKRVLSIFAAQLRLILGVHSTVCNV